MTSNRIRLNSIMRFA